MTVSDKVAPQNRKLIKAITLQGFKICGLGPLVIECGSATQKDVIKLAELLASSHEPQEGEDYVIISKTGEISECQTSDVTSPGNKNLKIPEASPSIDRNDDTVSGQNELPSVRSDSYEPHSIEIINASHSDENSEEEQTVESNTSDTEEHLVKAFQDLRVQETGFPSSSHIDLSSGNVNSKPTLHDRIKRNENFNTASCSKRPCSTNNQNSQKPLEMKDAEDRHDLRNNSSCVAENADAHSKKTEEMSQLQTKQNECCDVGSGLGNSEHSGSGIRQDIDDVCKLCPESTKEYQNQEPVDSAKQSSYKHGDVTHDSEPTGVIKGGSVSSLDKNMNGQCCADQQDSTETNAFPLMIGIEGSQGSLPNLREGGESEKCQSTSQKEKEEMMGGRVETGHETHQRQSSGMEREKQGFSQSVEQQDVKDGNSLIQSGLAPSLGDHNDEGCRQAETRKGSERKKERLNPELPLLEDLDNMDHRKIFSAGGQHEADYQESTVKNVLFQEPAFKENYIQDESPKNTNEAEGKEARSLIKQREEMMQKESVKKLIKPERVLNQNKDRERERHGCQRREQENNGVTQLSGNLTSSKAGDEEPITGTQSLEPRQEYRTTETYDQNDGTSEDTNSEDVSMHNSWRNGSGRCEGLSNVVSTGKHQKDEQNDDKDEGQPQEAASDEKQQGKVIPNQKKGTEKLSQLESSENPQDNYGSGHNHPKTLQGRLQVTTADERSEKRHTNDGDPEEIKIKAQMKESELLERAVKTTECRGQRPLQKQDENKEIKRNDAVCRQTEYSGTGNLYANKEYSQLVQGVNESDMRNGVSKKNRDGKERGEQGNGQGVSYMQNTFNSKHIKSNVSSETDSKSNPKPLQSDCSENEDTRNLQTVQGHTSRVAKPTISVSDEDGEVSDDELYYEMPALKFKLAKLYFEGERNSSFFNPVKEEREHYIFTLSRNNPDSEKFINTLRSLKFDYIHLSRENELRAQSAVSRVEGRTKAFVCENKIYLVGPKDEIQLAKNRVRVLLQTQSAVTSSLTQDNTEMRLRYSDEPGTGGRNKYSHIVSSSSGYDGARPKERRSESPKRGESQMGYSTSAPCSRSSGSSDMQSTGSDYYSSRNQVPQEYYGKSGKLKIKIYKTDITELKVDCIVNAANKRLIHGGGVAKAISSKAGKKLQEACAEHTRNGKTVDVTDVFVSPGGKLPAKWVLHAVGPKWEAYGRGEKGRCTDDLRQTVLRCLVEAGSLGMTSIALPSISAAIFKVPKELCARSYMEAVKHFDAFNAEQRRSPLCDIHFVDIDDTMINYIRESFYQYWDKPCSPDKKDKDFRFCHKHLSSRKATSSDKESSGHSHQSLWSAGRGAKPKETNNPSQASTEVAKGPVGGEDYMYEGLQLHVSSKPAVSFDTDVIIIIGEVFDKLSGICDFHAKGNLKPCRDMPFQKGSFEFLLLSKPGGLSPRLVCTVKPEPRGKEEIKAAFEKLKDVIRMATHVKSAVLTSSILFVDANNKTQKADKKGVNRKVVGNFAHCLLETWSMASESFQGILEHLYIAASEDTVPIFCRVFESRDTVKRISKHGSESYSGYSQNTSDEPKTGSRGRSHTPVINEPMGATSLESSTVLFGKGHSQQGAGTSVDGNKECEICNDDIDVAQPVPCCRKLICSGCKMKLDSCPFCRTFWRRKTGNQPDGYMTVTFLRYEHADGYEEYPVWKIEYFFSGGIQKECHPSPGKRYDTCSRTAYIPVCDDGLNVLKLLRLAFNRRLIFTIGTSQTTGKEDVITWNDIHHKTKLRGGIHGYPDPNYLRNVLSELYDKGVTYESMTDKEKQAISLFELILTRLNRFSDFGTRS